YVRCVNHNPFNSCLYSSEGSGDITLIKHFNKYGYNNILRIIGNDCNFEASEDIDMILVKICYFMVFSEWNIKMGLSVVKYKTACFRRYNTFTYRIFP